MLGRRSEQRGSIVPFVIHLVCGMSTLMLFAQADSFDNCWFRAPGEGRYRAQPEEQAVVLDTLLQHFKRHPQSPTEPLCIATPGHKALSVPARQRLVAAGVRVDATKNCHFLEDREIWSVDGAWRVGKDTFISHVTKSEFGHVSVWIAAYKYRLVSKEGSWVVVEETASPCNPKEVPPNAKQGQ